MTRLRLGLSHVCEHKFNIVFKIVLMLLAVACMNLKQLLSIYLTVSSTRTKE